MQQKQIIVGSLVALSLIAVSGVAIVRTFYKPKSAVVVSSPSPRASSSPSAPTPRPTLLPTASASATASPAASRRPSPSLIPKPSPSPSPSASPTPVPLSEIADVYMGSQLGFQDGAFSGWGQSMKPGTTTKVAEPLSWVQVYFANAGGIAAKDIQVNVYLDGKLHKTSTTGELAAGGNTTVTYDGGFPTESGVTHTIKITLNENRAFPEATYDNNTMEVKYVRE